MVAKRKEKPSVISQRLHSYRIKDVFTGAAEDLPRVFEAVISQIRPNPDQPRTEMPEESIKELASTIEQHGLIQPIAVTKDPENPEGFIVVAGGRRLAAFRHLGRTTIPAIMTAGNPDEIALIENIQRVDLHPLDEARALAKLMQRHGYTQEELSKIVGKARRTVGELLALTNLPNHIQDEWRTSAIPKSTLIELSRLNDQDDQTSMWELIKNDGLTVREARASKKGAPTPHQRKQPVEQALKAGWGFVQRLRKANNKETSLTHNVKDELQKLRDEIDMLLGQLNKK